MKNLKTFEKFDVINNDLKQSIKEYLLTEYPSDWWNNEFQSRLSDYIDDDDLIGYGEADDESTWDYETPEEAYENLCSGGAIEYDCITDIRKDIRNKFHLTDEEYDRNKIDDIVESHMCNMIDWYDHTIFGDKNDDNFLGTKNLMKHLTKKWDIDDLPTEIKTDDGTIIKL